MKLDSEWRIGHQSAGYRSRLEFAIWRPVDGGREQVVFHGDTHRLERLQGDEPIREPSFWLEKHEAQLIMDELWEMGLRPKDRRFQNEMDLMDDHLQDMRSIAFRCLDKLGLESKLPTDEEKDDLPF